jgi:alpha-glucosidase
MAIFHPFFRGHSSHDHGNKEPWAFGPSFEPLIRKAIELRYQLLPYIYTTFYQYTTQGTPMIRPLAFMSQHENETLLRMHEFGFGDQLLICPVKEAATFSRKMYLPKGNWFNYWTNKLVKGGQELVVDAPLDQFPLFVKAGAVVPHFPVIQNTKTEVNEITLHIYYAEHRHESFLYIDDYEGYEYRTGAYNLKKFTVFGNRRQFRIICDSSGNHNNPELQFRIVLHGLPFVPRNYEVDGKSVSVSSRHRKKELSFVAASGFQKIRISH